MAAFERSRIILKLSNDNIKVDKITPRESENINNGVRAGDYAAALEAYVEMEEGALVIRDEIGDYLPGDLDQYYCLRGVVEEVLIDGVKNDDFLDVLKLAVNGQTIVDNRYSWANQQLTNPMIFILTKEEHLDNDIHLKQFNYEDILFASYSYNSWHHIADFIEDAGGIIDFILDIMIRITSPNDDNDPVKTWYNFNNKEGVNQTLLSFQNDPGNIIEIQQMKPPVLWLLDRPSELYNITYIDGSPVMQGTFNDIYARAVKENAKVADKEGKLLIELGGKIVTDRVTAPDTAPGTASGTNKKSKKTKKAKKPKKSNKAKKSKAKKSKKVKSKKK